jgi:asparagine synthase (glutamine-hydrolysing)
MTMAFGLEARVPFLDHRLVEWSFGLPSNFKLRGNIGKAVVRRGMESYLSRGLLYAPKHGFNVPMKSWLEGELNSFVRDNLSEPVLKKRGIFNPAAVAQKIDAHAQGNQAASNQILTMLMLELWFQNYVDRRSSHLT